MSKGSCEACGSLDVVTRIFSLHSIHTPTNGAICIDCIKRATDLRPAFEAMFDSDDLISLLGSAVMASCLDRMGEALARLSLGATTYNMWRWPA